MDQTCYNNEQTRSEMLDDIRQVDFYLVELTEYLDTHPNDRRAICLHNEYSNKYRKMTDQYQMMYGPLMSKFPCNKWRWIDEPWPWEKGGSF